VREQTGGMVGIVDCEIDTCNYSYIVLNRPGDEIPGVGLSREASRNEFISSPTNICPFSFVDTPFR
jgi:hypothetical protein